MEQLTSLWDRLCTEVEAEIQEGVKRQLGFQTHRESFSIDDLNNITMETYKAEMADLSLVSNQQQQEATRTRRKYATLSKQVKIAKVSNHVLLLLEYYSNR